jgi:hypothetical protein
MRAPVICIILALGCERTTLERPPEFAIVARGSCLDSGPATVLIGAQPPLARLVQRVDARAASWTGTTRTPVRLSGAALCWSGGRIVGTFSETTSWATYHDAYSLLVTGAPGAVLERLEIRNYGDGPNFNGPGSDGWTLRDSELTAIHDDCISNDFGNAGTIEDVLFDGCYVGYSSRPYTTTPDNSAKVVTIRRSLWRLQRMPTGFTGRAGHGRFWKLDAQARDPKIALHDNVFRMDERPDCCGDYVILPAARLAGCSGNVMVWLGAGPWPAEPLPACFTLTRDRAVWDRAVATWRLRRS